MTENSVYHALVESIVPKYKDLHDLYIGTNEAAFSVKSGKKEYIFLLSAISVEEMKMLDYFSTHSQNDIYDFLEKRSQVLYTYLNDCMNLPLYLKLDDVTQKTMVEVPAGGGYLVQYVDKDALTSSRGTQRRLRLQSGFGFVVNKKWTLIFRKVYNGGAGRIKPIYAAAAILVVAVAAVVLGVFFQKKNTTDAEPRKVILSNLVGEKIEVAIEYLNECGIKYTFSEKVSDEVEKGIILAQSIRPYTTVQSGTILDLTVSSGKDYIVSVELEQQPARLSYCVGEDFDLSGLKLRTVYSSGAEKIISSGYTYSPQAASKIGDQAVVISYGENSCVLNVVVGPVELIGISVYSLPDKTDYKVGEKLDTYALKITLSMNNGTTKIIERGFEWDPAVLTSAGIQTVTLSYEGKTTEFKVNVRN